MTYKQQKRQCMKDGPVSYFIEGDPLTQGCPTGRSRSTGRSPGGFGRSRSIAESLSAPAPSLCPPLLHDLQNGRRSFLSEIASPAICWLRGQSLHFKMEEP
ncbi:Hypothetical predicted protein [Podarcis lilfordi]|uniref:Uncharacterized protein n=1 Tax=Podarcis lilfordi TaxID=74358 RepID=A0AA35PKX3_9SAUR|nr:Hypothetical predicted protein [Podarcis lilfordi]